MEQARFAEAAINAARHVPSKIGSPADDSNWLAGNVTWACAESPLDPADRIRDILRRSDQFMRRAGEPRLWVYVQEDGRKHGRHLHFLMYCPKAQQRKFVMRFRRWIKAQAGGRKITGAVCIRRVRDALGWKRYLLKESTPEVRAAFDIPDTMPSNGLPITGRRISFSKRLIAAVAAAKEAAAGGVVPLVQPQQRRAHAAGPVALAA